MMICTPKAVQLLGCISIRNKLKDFNFLLSCCPRGSINYEVIKIQKEEWLKSLKLEEDKILDDEE